MGITLPTRAPSASGNRRGRGISLPNVSNVPTVQPVRDPGLTVPAGVFDSGAAEAVDRLGGVAAQGAEAQLAIEDRERQGERDLQVARARSRFLTGKVNLDSAFDEDDDFDTFEERYTAGISESAAAAGNLIQNPQDREMFALSILDDIERGKVQIRDFARTRRRDAGVAGLNSAIASNMTAGLVAKDTETRDTLIANTLIEIEAAVDAGWITEVDGDRLKRQFGEEFGERFLDMRSPQEQVQMLQPYIDDPAARTNTPADLVAPDKRIALFEGARREMDRDHRLAVAEMRDAAREAAAVARTGRTAPGAEQTKTRLRAIGGADAQEMLADIAEAEAAGNEVAGFVRAPLAEQQAVLAARAAEEVASLDDLRVLDAMRSAHGALLTGLDRDPFRTAASYGVIDEVAEVDYSNPESLRARGLQAKMIGEQYGVEIAPLAPHEIKQLEAALDEIPAGQGAALLQSMQQGFGDEGVERVAAQFKNQRPAFALAIHQSTRDPVLAADILDGDRILRENKDLRPEPTIVEPAMEELGNLFQSSPEIRPLVRDGAVALYAKMKIANPAGNDDDMMETAVQRAAGARLDSDGNLMGGPVKFRGNTILPPTAESDEDTLDTIFDGLDDQTLTRYGNGQPQDALGRPITAEDIREHGKLENIAEGVYAVELGDTGYVMTDTGVFEIDLGLMVSEGGIPVPVARQRPSAEVLGLEDTGLRRTAPVGLTPEEARRRLRQ